MNDSLFKMRLALRFATDPGRLRDIATACLDAWADIDRCHNRRDEGGYEAGFYATQDGLWPAPAKAGTWVQLRTGSRDFCVGYAQGRQEDCDVADYYRVRSLSGLEVWPEWGRGVLDGDDAGEVRR